MEVKAKAKKVKAAEVKAEQLGVKVQVEEEVKAEVETIKETEVEEGGRAIPPDLHDHDSTRFSLDRYPMGGLVGWLVVGQWVVGGWLVDLG